MKKYLLLLTVGAVLIGCKPRNRAGVDIDPYLVRTSQGAISGTVAKSGVYMFKGIPYAQPPVGALRWTPPQPMTPWDDIRKCTRFGPNAMQGKPVPRGVYTAEFLIPNDTVSEDCLYLNVWTNAGTTYDKRPVLVWIHGGGFGEGSGSVPLYDGEALARKGVVVVTVNYRLGLFGFFSHPELSLASGNDASGNYGLMDQIAALQWVKQNITLFGGDTTRITLAGQSAGAMSVHSLVVSPLAKGLFQQAIAQSGAFMVPGMIAAGKLADAEQAGVKLGEQLGAKSLAELRKVAADTLLAHSRGMSGPIIDGVVLPAAPAEIYASGKANKVNLLTGWNEDDWFLFGPPQTAAQFRDGLYQRYGSRSTELLTYYPATNDAEALASQKALIRDSMFGIQNFAWANTASQDPAALVWVYNFTRRLPASDDLAQYGAFHSGELAYVFNNLAKYNRPWEKGDQNMAKALSSYWINFITGGNPNGIGLAPWPRYSATNGLIMQLDVDQKAVPLPNRKALELLIP